MHSTANSNSMTGTALSSSKVVPAAPGGSEIIGHSLKMRDVLAQVEMVAPTDCAVLLHNRSVRRDGCLIRINCAAIPSGLLESELFGHERGAFTGALSQRQG